MIEKDNDNDISSLFVHDTVPAAAAEFPQAITTRSEATEDSSSRLTDISSILQILKANRPSYSPQDICNAMERLESKPLLKIEDDREPPHVSNAELETTLHHQFATYDEVKHHGGEEPEDGSLEALLHDLERDSVSDTPSSPPGNPCHQTKAPYEDQRSGSPGSLGPDNSLGHHNFEKAMQPTQVFGRPCSSSSSALSPSSQVLTSSTYPEREKQSDSTTATSQQHLGDHCQRQPEYEFSDKGKQKDYDLYAKPSYENESREQIRLGESCKVDIQSSRYTTSSPPEDETVNLQSWWPLPYIQN